MKLVAVVGAGALAFLSSMSARAADLPGVRPAIPAAPGYIPARYLWTGFYLGAAAGGGWGKSTFYDPFGGVTDTVSVTGFLVGGYTGINYQIDPVVIGIDFDFIGSFVHGSDIDTAGNSLQTKVFWTSSVTGRVGWALDRLLIYGKGGVGFAYHRDTVTATFGVPIGSAVNAGWTFGGGLEYAITEHWIARAEYDFFKFPTKALLVSPSAAPGNVQIGIDLNEAKGGIAYKF